MKTESLIELAALPENKDLYAWCMQEDDQEQIYSEYSDAYKSVHNFRPRWAYDYTREQFFFAFLSLREDAIYEAEQESRQAEDDAYWADERNNPIAKPEWIRADKYEAMAGEPL